MTVKELIELLNKYPPELEVVVPIPEWWEGETYHNPPCPDFDDSLNAVIL
jgi:hypothetical protein